MAISLDNEMQAIETIIDLAMEELYGDLQPIENFDEKRKVFAKLVDKAFDLGFSVCEHNHDVEG